jgi:DNA-binding transcriptional ArsR family regulator
MLLGKRIAAQGLLGDARGAPRHIGAAGEEEPITDTELMVGTSPVDVYQARRRRERAGFLRAPQAAVERFPAKNGELAFSRRVASSALRRGDAMSAVVLSDAVLGLVARRMQLLSDPLRIRLLLALQDGEASVQELADVLDTEHRNASRSLNALYRDGVLTRRREGKRVLYSVADYTASRSISQAAESVAAQIEELSDLVLQSA